MGSLQAVMGGCIYTGKAVLREHAVLIRDGKIIGTPKRTDVPGDADCTDVGSLSIAPGFVDLQVNGGGGLLFNEKPTAAALKTIAKAHEHFGTLHFCPTVITSSEETMTAALAAVREAMDADTGVLGAHLEGPFISPKRPGIHEQRFIRKASDEEIEGLLKAGESALRIITAAPEAVTEDQICRLTKAGVRVFLGHSDVSYQEARRAFDAGACGVTHLFNAMSAWTGREPGLVGACFDDTQTWAGIIADGFHVAMPSIRLAKRIKGGRLFLVSDAMPPLGKPETEYRIGSREIVCKDGRCTAPDGTLAGSAVDMASALRNCVQHCGIPLDEALRMASGYPAELLGLSGVIGAVRAGCKADLVLLDEDLRLRGIVRRGELHRWTE